MRHARAAEDGVQAIAEHLVRHGATLVFANVFAQQIGVPVPAEPILFLAGSLVTKGSLSPVRVVMATVAGAAIADAIWFLIGRHFGPTVRRLFRRRSPARSHEPAQRGGGWFERWGLRALLVARFVPGGTQLIVPVAGARQVPFAVFFLYDLAGIVLWAALPFTGGMFFHSQIEGSASGPGRRRRLTAPRPIFVVAVRFLQIDVAPGLSRSSSFGRTYRSERMRMLRAGASYGLEIAPVVAAESDVTGAAAARAVARAHAQKNCAAVILAIARLATPDLPPRQRERFERLGAAATRLVTLLNDEMREAAGAEAAEDGEEVEVAQLLGAACDLVRDRAEAHGVTLVVSCAGGRMRGDARALTEVLVNLIGNAIDASSAGHSVSVDGRMTPAGGQQWIIEDAGQGCRPTCSRGWAARSARRGRSARGSASRWRPGPSARTGARCVSSRGARAARAW